MLITPPSTNNVEFGLQNKNSASERIGQIRAAVQRVDQNNANERNINSDGSAEFGLQDRNSANERVDIISGVAQRVTENHGFEAKKATRDALANNTKIINTPPLERGSLLDIRI